MKTSVKRLVVPALFVGAAALYLTRLGAVDLWAPDEPRLAQVAAELFAMQDGWRSLVVLQLVGEPYTQKPPLYYWLAALASLPAGAVTETAVRLPSALAGLATLALTLRLGTRLFGPRVGAWSVAVLMGVYEFDSLARRAQFDVLLCACVCGALLAWLRLEQGSGSPRRNLAALHACLGLGVLTKGPVALLPLIVVAIAHALEHRARELRRLLPAWGLALSLGPGLVWITAAVALTPGGFFEEAVVENLWGRAVEGTSHAQPFPYYLYQLPIAFLPWTLAWPLGWTAWRRARREPDGDQARRFRLPLVWVATYVGLLSLSTGKRGLYLLPCYPALAILSAAGLVAALDRRAELPRWLERGAPIAFAAASCAGLAVALAGGALVHPASGFRVSAAFGGAMAALGAAAAAAWLALRRNGASAEGRIAVLAASAAAVQLAVFTLLLPPFDAEKSPRPIAETAARLAPPESPIGVFHHRALAGGLAFYARRRVVALDSPEDVRAFFAEGGRVIAVRERYLERLAPSADFEVRGSFRTGERAYTVVTASPR